MKEVENEIATFVYGTTLGSRSVKNVKKFNKRNGKFVKNKRFEFHESGKMNLLVPCKKTRSIKFKDVIKECETQ